MRIIQLTPGAGPMFCGNCFRDNTLVKEMRAMGHEVLMVPLYLPLSLDEPDQTDGAPIFFSGINVYLGQKSALFRAAPDWLRRGLAAPWLLRKAAGRAARTRAEELGEVTLSMLRGEDGRQARDLDELCAWLKKQPRPDAIFLSNALLLGLARRLKSELGVPLICMLQGEDTFLDVLPEPHRTACWQTLAQRAVEVDRFVAPSRFFAEFMRHRLDLPVEQVRVVFNGINLEGYGHQDSAGSPTTSAKTPVLGFFARMCREKGLDTLVEAYLLLRQRGRVKDLKLRAGGSCGPGEAPFIRSLRERLRTAGLDGDVEFCPNPGRVEKCAFLKSLSVFSVPARYDEAFGLYLLEALASGVPVVQPRIGAFPELIEATGGGRLCAPGDTRALAEALESLLLNPDEARALAERGRRAVRERFSARQMAEGMVEVAHAATVVACSATGAAAATPGSVK